MSSIRDAGHPGHAAGILRSRTASGDFVFKSAEEREAERREREAAEAREQAARAEQARVAFMATPIGAATLAKEAGQAFFEVQLQVGGHTGSAGFGSTDGRRTTSSSAATLGEIESSAGACNMRATTSWSLARPARLASS